MTKDEALKLALEALDVAQSLLEKSRHHGKILAAYDTIKEALAQPEQEPVAWRDPTNIDPGQGCTYTKERREKWPHIYRQALYTAPPAAQPEQERNFCPRCGKRTKDLTTIHTCTPPQEST